MIAAVSLVTHIAPADENGEIIGLKLASDGVTICEPAFNLVGLCAGATNAFYTTTTEVYPDSPKTNEEECNRAQCACVVSGLDFIAKAEGYTK